MIIQGGKRRGPVNLTEAGLDHRLQAYIDESLRRARSELNDEMRVSPHILPSTKLSHAGLYFTNNRTQNTPIVNPPLVTKKDTYCGFKPGFLL